MIDIEKAKQELKKQVEEQKIENPKVANKLAHIMRVAEISKNIATELKLVREQIQLAELIGLLHDIGRFQQYKIVDTVKRFNHGEAGVQILKKDNNIRKYIKKDKYDEIIYTAVYEHNRYEITKGLTEEKKLFCKIIKDADKIDLIYEGAEVYWKHPDVVEQIEMGKLSEKMLADFYEYKLADIRNKMGEIDEVLRFTSYIFDINFEYSFKILKQKNDMNKMIERFHYQIPETKQQMVQVKKIANEYIEKKLHTK